MDQLYPAPLYYDFQQLNYYHANPAFRRINMVTFNLGKVAVSAVSGVQRSNIFSRKLKRMELNCLIVDDEPLALDLENSYCRGQ